MGRFQTFQQFLATQTAQVSILGFMFNIFLTALFAFILSRIYVRYGTSLSNRRMFGNNFVMVATTTMFIIAVIKSSLALSLGLVGALSIVRFRAAIKEPEELAYLFLNIAIGLGFGADQRLITIVAFCVICGLIVTRRRYHDSSGTQNLFLTITSHNPRKIKLEDMIDVLKTHCAAVELKRFDETSDVLEASFQVEFNDIKALQQTKQALQHMNESVKITFLDNRGIL